MEDQSADPNDRIEVWVEVPNAEFVALIVGRNGHKIKAIRERTGTFIKTPLRNETPIFKVAGCATNVMLAKTEILNIVQSLKSHQYRFGALMRDGQDVERVVINVRVPFRLVGLVVGFQGHTIQEIQVQSETHIQTPAYGGEPIFQITGGRKNVIVAKLLIQRYIQQRTNCEMAVEIESFLGEDIDPTILQLLCNHGLHETLAILMEKDSLSSESSFETDALDKMAEKSDATEDSGFVTYDGFNFDFVNARQRQRHNSVETPMTPDHAPLDPLAAFHDSVATQDMAAFQHPMCLNNFDATTLSPLMLHAINSLPDIDATPSPCQWTGPRFDYPPPPFSGPTPTQVPLYEPYKVDTFWEYVANVNNLPRETVL